MDLRQLEMFQAIAEAGSFTKAGDRLHVSQSAISRQIKLLEEELGVQVLMRINKRVFLTETGQTLLKHCHRVFRDIEEAVLEVSANGQLNRGSLRIAGGMSVCTYLLPQLLKRYKTLYPNIKLTVSTGNSEPIIRQIRNNEIDLGFLTLPVVANDLQVVSILREEMVVVTSIKHPLSVQRQITPQDIAAAPLILFERGSNTRKVIDQFFLDQHLTPQIIMEMENVEIIKPLVEIGLGITIIPYQSIVREVQAGKLHFSRIAGHRLYRDLGLVFLKMDYMPSALQEMIKLFQAMIPKLQKLPPRSGRQ